jgi:hypothetical protein
METNFENTFHVCLADQALASLISKLKCSLKLLPLYLIDFFFSFIPTWGRITATSLFYC